MIDKAIRLFKFLRYRAYQLRSEYAQYCRQLPERLPGLILSEDVRFIGQPLIELVEGARISIGRAVTLNSLSDDYHLNIHSSVKLMADRRGAEIEIGDLTRIHGSCIHAWNSVKIGRSCLIAANCQIMDANGHDLCLGEPSRRINSQDTPRPVTIGDAVWLGAHCIILPGVTVGRGSVIGAGSVVTHNIPAFTVAAGIPARVVKNAHPHPAI